LKAKQPLTGTEYTGTSNGAGSWLSSMLIHFGDLTPAGKRRFEFGAARAVAGPGECTTVFATISATYLQRQTTAARPSPKFEIGTGRLAHSGARRRAL